MSTQHSYTLERYKGKASRYVCPACRQKHSFSRYIAADSSYLADNVGRCNRESSCGYHYTPKQYFTDHPNEQNRDTQPLFTPQTDIMREPSFIPHDTYAASRAHYEQNNFVIYLLSRFDRETVINAIRRYNIGTSKHWPGATVFWQVDSTGRVHTGKIMLYDATTGKRVKKPFNHITWVHALSDKAKRPLFPDFNLQQCYYGEHLLTLYPEKKIAIVESEKTAVIASIYYPAYNWLACGSLQGFTKDKARSLYGTDITAYPDLNGFDKWSARAGEFAGLACVEVSNILESIATEEERKNGLDLADYLLRLDYKIFQRRQAFINDVLSSTEVEQGAILRKYVQIGLTKEDHAFCISELINKHGFAITA